MPEEAIKVLQLCDELNLKSEYDHHSMTITVKISPFKTLRRDVEYEVPPGMSLRDAIMSGQARPKPTNLTAPTN